MQQVTVRIAKTQLSRLIEAALNGEEVIIARGSKPVAKLVPIPEKPFIFGLLSGKLGGSPDFLSQEYFL
jgi:antitoxin (DNA-binding transcriptional repressor) of toxin-antitoxin stability system